MSKKRTRSSIFDAVEQLESVDARAAKKRTTVARDKAKTKAAQSQTKLFGNLMECRILLQRVMTVASSDVVDEDACNDLLVNLLQARSQLMFHGDQDYAHLVQNNHAEDDGGQLLNATLGREYKECRAEWEEVLNRRHRDLQLHSGLAAKAHFKVMDSSFWQQVEATVAHELASAPDDDVHDDAKLYQHMLQDFLVLAGKAPVDAKSVAKRKSSNKPKKEMDRRATKGRKIRYMVVPKLVNFTFPVERMQSNTSGMDEEEWFKSLFGGAARNAAQE
jgi:hypothetical protein